MRTVRTEKGKLLEVVKKNRTQHREIFEEALEGYHKELLTYLDKMKNDVKNGKKIEHHIRLPQPIDQTKDYDRAIKMLDMSVDDIIELTEDEFANLVMDDWSWTGQFINSNSIYSGKAVKYASSKTMEY